MDLGLKNKRALVMGGTKGLGRSIADALAAEGAAVTISGRTQATLDEAAAALQALGAASAVGVVADVASGEAMDDLAAAAVAAMGGVDILVLNHGGPPRCTASQMQEADLVKWFQHIVTGLAFEPGQPAQAMEGMNSRQMPAGSGKLLLAHWA